jgi:hypothetical protein
MRLRLAAVLTIGALLIAPACFAQTPSGIPGSGQGGYLGITPAAPPAPGTAPMGGAPAASADDMKSSPTAWCIHSPEPSRCRGRAAIEAEICANRDGASYSSCRFAVDQMHGN